MNRPIILRGLLPVSGAPYIATGNPYFGAASWTVCPEEVFRPHGLMLWNLPDDETTVEFAKIGTIPQLVAAVGPIPARWFTMAQSYQQVWDAHRAGEDPPGWGDWQVIGLAMRFEIKLSAPRQVGADEWARVQILLWGERLLLV